MTATPRAPAPAPPPVQVFVFDDRLGQKEGDELSKILARFPSRVPDDALASDLGLVEGVARFASYFVARRKSSSDASASSSSSSSSRASLFETKTQTIRSRRRRVTCASFEPNLWWTLAIDDRVAPADEIRDAALVELLARANESHVLVRPIHWSPYDPVRVVNADP
ncbi:uncharacterized protein MICPUCDRAFT_69849 [Micromonas pusilla CCMP1545]|jgi:hypothetical protein|uniref:Predicted protein n=1 Tax=Micromonas pusilla (strain CCMP1545) TaxID=564608 RepID=C1N2H8_MICPC|nr:uncharacterized protein MICPUCDRAFT_69849 [Micromonas pusilla CCMP1545]EEH53586.1 predicted protein [Micromonas pusilla CCMP1545]|eukprot:XP_003061874.1 predicted protein [Micromonas pusilla CCMP1545]